jgi:hypothetical protein
VVGKLKEAKKGILVKKNVTGRQLTRVSAIDHQETIWSEVFPGNQHTVNCLPDALKGVQSSLELDEKQRRRTVWRMDGGGGSDANFRLLLQQGYQLHAKGLSSSRAAVLAKKVSRWDAYADIWLGEVEPTFDLGRPVRVFIQRRRKKEQFLHNYFVSTLKLPSKMHFLAHYNDRGGAETEQFREDKSGLAMAIRRKRSLNGQKGYILLTDLAHNLLADFKHHALSGSRFEGYGIKRIVRDLLCMPGMLVFDDQKLVRIELLSQKQNAADLLICLERYCFTRFS